MGDARRPVILVTGGSRGIGAACARLAADHGYDVCLSYRTRSEEAEAVCRDVASRGARAHSVRADVSDEADVLRMFSECDEILGGIQALVNNAGILNRQCRFDDISAERFQRVLAVNVIGPFLCTREAIRRMSTARGGQGGAVVNVSSRAAVLGSPFEYVDYAASKGALDTMTVGVAKEVAAEGIRVNGVRPGFIYTEMHADGGEPDRVDRLKSSIPLGRGGEPEDIAEAVIWLLSDKSSYATGAILDLAGGR